MNSLLKSIKNLLPWIKKPSKTIEERLEEAAKKPINFHQEVVEILRGKNRGITKKVGDSFYAKLSAAEIKAKVAELNNAFLNKTLMELLDYLVAIQEKMTAREAPDMDMVSFGRATINGFDLIREHLEEAHSRYEEMVKGGEKFDEFELIPKS